VIEVAAAREAEITTKGRHARGLLTVLGI